MNLQKKSDGKGNTNTITLTYGLAQWIETDINLIFKTLIPDSGETEFGFGDTILAGKFRVIDERKILPAILIEPSISFPTGSASKGTGSGETELGLLLVIEKTLGKLTGRANLGYFAANLDEDYKDRIFYAFELDFPISNKLRLASEVTGNTDSRARQGSVFTLTGLLFEITKT